MDHLSIVFVWILVCKIVIKLFPCASTYHRLWEAVEKLSGWCFFGSERWPCGWTPRGVCVEKSSEGDGALTLGWGVADK